MFTSLSNNTYGHSAIYFFLSAIVPFSHSDLSVLVSANGKTIIEYIHFTQGHTSNVNEYVRVFFTDFGFLIHPCPTAYLYALYPRKAKMP